MEDVIAWCESHINLIAWCVKHEALLGNLLLWIGVTTLLIGLPLQIKKNYVRKSSGFHVTITVLPLAIYCVRMPYNVANLAWYAVPADLIALSLSFIIFCQYVWYDTRLGHWLGRNIMRRTSLDTVALVVFSVLVGLPTTFVIERYMLGFTFAQWAGVRLVYSPLRIVMARLLGKLADSIRTRVGGEHPTRISKAFADSLALALYQPLVFLFSALVVGVSMRQIGLAIPIYIVGSFLTGGLYGIILDYVRRQFGENNLVLEEERHS